MLLNSLPDPQERLYPGNAFSFSCHKDLACFGTCCRNRDLTLTPYDVLNILDEHTRPLIEKDDLELLLLGFSYLRVSLFS